MWTSPLTSRESAGLKLEEGPHSREHSSRVVGTQDAIAVAEGTKHRDVGTRITRATIAGKKGTLHPCVARKRGTHKRNPNKSPNSS